MFTWCLHDVYMHAIFARCLHTLFTHAVYTRCLHTLFTHAVYTRCLHTLFTHAFYTRCLHTLFTQTVYTRCLHYYKYINLGPYVPSSFGLATVRGLVHNVCKTVWLSEALLVYGDMIRTILAATIDSLDDLRKLSKISFFVVTHAQSCWTVVDFTKSVSAELSDFGLWCQLKVESEIKSPWTLKNNIKLY
jgi:hypothetical protein